MHEQALLVKTKAIPSCHDDLSLSCIYCVSASIPRRISTSFTARKAFSGVSIFESPEHVGKLSGVTTHTDASGQKQHDGVVDDRRGRNEGLRSSNMYGYQPGVITPALRFGILRPFPESGKFYAMQFAVLLTGQTAGTPLATCWRRSSRVYCFRCCINFPQ